MTVKQLKQKLENIPDNMDVFIRELNTEFSFGLLNEVKVKKNYIFRCYIKSERHLFGFIRYGINNFSISKVSKMATKLDLAEAQLLGWSHGKRGEWLTSLVQSMGLTKTEWTKIKAQYPNTLNNIEKQEVDEYFENKY